MVGIVAEHINDLLRQYRVHLRGVHEVFEVHKLLAGVERELCLAHL